MKAALIYQHGGPDVLQYQDVEDPAVGPRHACVKVEAAAVNPLD